MNGHQVIRLPSRFREPLLEKLIEGMKIVEPPVLPAPHFTEITAELDEPRIALPLRRSLPTQDLIDLGQDEQSPATVELRSHKRSPVTRQGR